MSYSSTHILFWLLFVAFCATTVRAQTTDVLNKTISRLEAKEGLQVDFRMTLEDETTDCKYLSLIHI